MKINLQHNKFVVSMHFYVNWCDFRSINYNRPEKCQRKRHWNWFISTAKAKRTKKKKEPAIETMFDIFFFCFVFGSCLLSLFVCSGYEHTLIHYFRRLFFFIQLNIFRLSHSFPWQKSGKTSRRWLREQGVNKKKRVKKVGQSSEKFIHKP